jgi:hypothetical protein
MASLKTERSVIVGEPQDVLETLVVIQQLANSPRVPYVMIPTMDAVKVANSLQLQKFVDRRLMQHAILKKPVQEIPRPVPPTLQNQTVQIAGMGCSALLERVRLAISNASKLSMEVAEHAMIHLVC